MRFIRLSLAVTVLLAACRPGVACPFCTALKPTLAQLREQSAVTALAEVESQSAKLRSRLRVHRVLKGEARMGAQHALDASLDLAAKPGSLVLLLGTAGDAAAGELAWHAVGVNETSYAYFARAPALSAPTAQRLRYFAPFLEHADALVAEDAYLEFGHAPFDQVARSGNTLSMSKVRAWLVDPNVPPERKGFYGLALGLCTDAAERSANAAFLRTLVLEPADDFRAGFDGILGGYLLLAGLPGLELVESRYLANPRAADGDVRHALTAVRFYHEYGREIPAPRLAQALRPLVKRPEFAAAAITDLGRWQDWQPLEEIAALYTCESPESLRRAIVGYLLACNEPKAAAALKRLRELDPRGVAESEQVLSRTSSVPQNQ